MTDIIIITLLLIIAVLAVILIILFNKGNKNRDIYLQLEAMQKNISEQLALNRDRTNEVISFTNNMITNVTSMMELRLKTIQESNEKSLDKIRGTVDEKLEEKLALSFKTVSTQLEQVHKGLGEMQALAHSVGDLKKIMGGVKTRGILGEITLGGILEEMLSKNQFETNIATVPGSREVVEYAVKLPGKEETPVYIPIDAKFPVESYKKICDAYDSGDNIDSALKELEKRIKSEAKDIHTKYVYPPNTTDFAIMFLPSEGLYAEVVRNTELFEYVMNTYSVLIAGPSTLSALLCSLQMGFKTLAVSNRAAKVWEVLAQVKKEFEAFAEVLSSVQKKLTAAENDMDKLIGVRTRQIISKLDKMQNQEEENE